MDKSQVWHSDCSKKVYSFAGKNYQLARGQCYRLQEGNACEKMQFIDCIILFLWVLCCLMQNHFAFSLTIDIELSKVEEKKKKNIKYKVYNLRALEQFLATGFLFFPHKKQMLL